MKIQVLAALLLSLIVSTDALACFPKEAQVIGTVASKRIYKVDQGIVDCYYKIENITHFAPSQVCPLSMEDLPQLEINDWDCDMDLEPGAPVSGVISVKEFGHVDLD